MNTEAVRVRARGSLPNRISCRLTSLSVSLLVVLGAGVAVPLMTATPASAASTCNAGDREGPYEITAVDATNDASAHMVLATTPPWAWGSWAYVWRDNNDARQRWVVECRSYNSAHDINLKWIRYQADLNLCLTAYPISPGVRLAIVTCGSSPYTSGQLWEFRPDGPVLLDDPRGIYTQYEVRNTVNEACVDVYNGNSTNGTIVEEWSCNGLPNQRWVLTKV